MPLGLCSSYPWLIPSPSRSNPLPCRCEPTFAVMGKGGQKPKQSIRVLQVQTTQNYLPGALAHSCSKPNLAPEDKPDLCMFQREPHSWTRQPPHTCNQPTWEQVRKSTRNHKEPRFALANRWFRLRDRPPVTHHPPFVTTLSVLFNI